MRKKGKKNGALDERKRIHYKHCLWREFWWFLGGRGPSTLAPHQYFEKEIFVKFPGRALLSVPSTK